MVGSLACQLLNIIFQGQHIYLSYTSIAEDYSAATENFELDISTFLVIKALTKVSVPGNQIIPVINQIFSIVLFILF